MLACSDGSERLSATAAAGVVGRKAHKRCSSNPCKLRSTMCWTVCCSSASDAGHGGMGPGLLGQVLWGVWWGKGVYDALI